MSNACLNCDKYRKNLSIKLYSILFLILGLYDNRAASQSTKKKSGKMATPCSNSVNGVEEGTAWSDCDEDSLLDLIEACNLTVCASQSLCQTCVAQ